MIRIVATFQVRPDAVASFVGTARQLVTASQAEEGNISYELLQARQDPAVLTILEAWADDEAIAAHNASVHFTTLVPVLADLCQVPPSVIQYTAV